MMSSYGLDDPSSILGKTGFFSTPQHPGRLWGPPNLLSNGYRGAKQPGREADHSPPSSTEVKNGGAISPLSTYAFM
jgi:hypothetical protein